MRGNRPYVSSPHVIIDDRLVASEVLSLDSRGINVQVVNLRLVNVQGVNILESMLMMVVIIS